MLQTLTRTNFVYHSQFLGNSQELSFKGPISYSQVVLISMKLTTTPLRTGHIDQPQYRLMQLVHALSFITLKLSVSYVRQN